MNKEELAKYEEWRKKNKDMPYAIIYPGCKRKWSDRVTNVYMATGKILIILSCNGKQNDKQIREGF